MEVRSEVFRVKLLQKKGINVPMIFVSNKHYWRHSDNEDESEEMQSNDSTLGLPATGIPFLRRLLTSLPMKVVFRSLDEYRQRFISLTEALQTVVERETPKDPVLMKHLTDSLMVRQTRRPLVPSIADWNRQLQRRCLSRILLNTPSVNILCRH